MRLLTPSARLSSDGVAGSIEADPAFARGVAMISATIQCAEPLVRCRSADPRARALARNLTERLREAIPYALAAFSRGRAAFELGYEWHVEAGVHLLAPLKYRSPCEAGLRTEGGGGFAGLRLLGDGRSARLGNDRSWLFALDADRNHRLGRSRYSGAVERVWRQRQEEANRRRDQNVGLFFGRQPALRSTAASDGQALAALGVPPAFAENRPSHADWQTFYKSCNDVLGQLATSFKTQVVRCAEAVNAPADSAWNLRVSFQLPELHATAAAIALAKAAVGDGSRSPFHPPGVFDLTAFLGRRRCGRRRRTGVYELARKQSPVAEVRRLPAHAPVGGATIGGKFFHGGWFIPLEDLLQAAPQQLLDLLKSAAPAGDDRGITPTFVKYEPPAESTDRPPEKPNAGFFYFKSLADDQMNRLAARGFAVVKGSYAVLTSPDTGVQYVFRKHRLEGGVVEWKEEERRRGPNPPPRPADPPAAAAPPVRKRDPAQTWSADGIKYTVPPDLWKEYQDALERGGLNEGVAAAADPSRRSLRRIQAEIMADFALHILEVKIHSGDPKFREFWTLAGSPDLSLMRREIFDSFQDAEIDELGRKFDLLCFGLPIGKFAVGVGKVILQGAGAAARRQAVKQILKLVLETSEPKLVKPPIGKPAAPLVRGAEEGAPAVRWKPDTTRGPWGFRDDLARGKILEAKLGKNLPDAFPYFDAWDAAAGRAVSIKTADLTKKLVNVENTLRDAVRKLA